MLHMDFHNDLFFTHACMLQKISTFTKAHAQWLFDKWKQFSAV